MIGSAEAAGPGREGHSRRVASITRDLTDSSAGRSCGSGAWSWPDCSSTSGCWSCPRTCWRRAAPLEPDAVEPLHGHADLSGGHPGASGPGRPARGQRQGPPRAPGRPGYPRGLRPPDPLRRPGPRRGRHLGGAHPAATPPPGHVRAGRAGRAAPAGEPRPPVGQVGRRPRAPGDPGPAGRLAARRAGPGRRRPPAGRESRTRTTRRHRAVTWPPPHPSPRVASPCRCSCS